MPQIGHAQDPVVLSYAALRRVVGYVAFLLAFLVAVPVYVLHGYLLHSISAYYYTATHNVFVGSLCAIATFMLCTRGYERSDEVASFLAAIFALGVAFFPTEPEGTAACTCSLYHQSKYIHYGSATALFVTLAYFCLFLFTRSYSADGPTPRKRTRNKVYVGCGVAIVISIVMLGVVAGFKLDQGAIPWFAVFETTALIAFGFAWMVKGETFGFLNDRVPTPTHTLTSNKIFGFATPPAATGKQR